MKLIVLTYFIGTLYFTPFKSMAQDKATDIEFVLDKIKVNYPGLPFKNKLNVDSLMKYFAANNITDTFRILSEIVMFYKDYHLIIYDYNNYKLYGDSIVQKRKIDSLQFVFNKKENKNKFDKKEGYWKSDYNNCIVFLKRKSKSPTDYIAYTVESNSGAPYGSTFFTLEKKGKVYLTDYTSTYYKTRFFCNSFFKNNDSILINDTYGKWRKISNYKPNFLKDFKTFTSKPEIINLDSATILVKLPSCRSENVAIMDSLVKQHHPQLQTAKTLIIDIRNNSGGTLRAYYPLMPYIVSGSILKQAYFEYCTTDIIKEKVKSLERVRKAGRLIRAAEIEKELDTMQKSLGQLIFYKSDTMKFDTVYRNPKYVAIIANYACMSASEYMLLDCMQSNKVKVFGEPTAGANDYLDYSGVYTPSNKYYLYIPSTKRKISSFEKTDLRLRIIPNVLLDEKVADWVEYVKKYYEKL